MSEFPVDVHNRRLGTFYHYETVRYIGCDIGALAVAVGGSAISIWLGNKTGYDPIRNIGILASCTAGLPAGIALGSKAVDIYYSIRESYMKKSRAL